MSEHTNGRYEQVEEPVDPRRGNGRPATMKVPERQPAGIPAWLRFAGIILIMTGVFNAIEGLVGLFDSDFYLVHPDDILLFDVTGWSWVHSVVGCLVAFTGVALCRGATWARPATIALATLNCVSQLVFVAVYPIWSLIVIALCVVVIWAVVVHGDDTAVER